MNITGFRETTKFILFNTLQQDSLQYSVMWLNLTDVLYLSIDMGKRVMQIEPLK